MNMLCAKCGGPIGRQVGAGGRRKFCATCSPQRVRRDRPRTRSAATVAPLPVVPTDGDVEVTNIFTATLNEVRGLKMEQHWLGVLALHVAHWLDNSEGESGSAVASTSKAFREVLDDMRAQAPQPEEESPLEVLRRQHRDRGAGSNRHG